jgi:hypothetical protein
MSETKARDRESATPDLSEFGHANFFRVREEFRSTDPFSEAMARLGDEAGSRSYARVDLELPMGCDFSLFLVRGWQKGHEASPMLGTLVISRALAEALAEGLEGAEILEFPVRPPER